MVIPQLNDCHLFYRNSSLKRFYHRELTVSIKVAICHNFVMTMDVKLRFGLRLRQLRKKYNYTQWKLSELSDVDYKHIQLLEGKRPTAAKIDTLEKLAKAFNMPLSKLLDFK